MQKYLNMLFLFLLIFSGCFNTPSTEKLEGDIKIVEADIKDAKETVQKYNGGLLSVLANVRLETCKTTKSMLEQKKIGLHRYISLSYSIAGKEYASPGNKNNLLQELNDDLRNLQLDLAKTKEKSAEYNGGLLRLVSLTQVVIIENSIAFLNQKRLLLKHDIPYYSVILSPSNKNEPDFQLTSGKGIEKF